MAANNRIDRLLVSWRSPRPSRYEVGILERTDGGYAFEYVSERKLQRAIDKGFRLLAEFPERRRYESGYLFSTFASRIPEPSRPDRADVLSQWGVEHPDDPMEILHKSGGLRVTDPLELMELRDDLQRPLEFRVAGMEFQDSPSDLGVGEQVTLLRDPEDEGRKVDEHATLVVVRGDRRIGYVPNCYSPLIAAAVDAGTLTGGQLVRRLRIGTDRLYWVVRVEPAAPRR